MKYFVDFEATQFTNEIISVGCIAEDNDTFSSYVHASKISNFITSLTGITKEINAAAASSDRVFSDFYDWLTVHTPEGEPVIFYSYGTSDIEFIKKNLSKTTNLKAQAALSLIAMNLEDYCPYVKSHFGLVKNIRLSKVVAYYRGVDEINQIHDALEDAKYLKEIYDCISAESRVTSHPFPDYEMRFENITESEVGKMRKMLATIPHTVEVRDDNEKIVQVFSSINLATEWIKKNFHKGSNMNFSHKQAANKIINANRLKKKYCGYHWDIFIYEEEEEI